MEDCAMDEVALVGSMQGPQDHTLERTPILGNSHTLMHPHSVSPRLRYSSYGIRTASATIGTTHIVKGQSEVTTATLRSKVDGTHA